MPTPAAEDTSPSDPWGSSTQSPTASKSAHPATSKQPETQPSIDAWATPVEPSPEVKATESEVLAASLAGLEGDAWGGSTFGQDRGQPMAAVEPIGRAADALAKGKPMAGAEPVGEATDTMAKGRPIGEAEPSNHLSSVATPGEQFWCQPFATVSKLLKLFVSTRLKSMSHLAPRMLQRES